MTGHRSRSPGQYLKMGLHIREPELELSALMMRDNSSRDVPEPRERRLASDHRQAYRPGKGIKKRR